MKNNKQLNNTKKSYALHVYCILSIIVVLSSCVTSTKTIPESPITYETPSTNIMGTGIKNADSLTSFFMAENTFANKEKVERLSKLYIEEANLEGVNSDVAFAQMCLETGFLRFGGLVTEDMNNFCGLGAIDETQRGNIFKTEQEGVRAHIQHLKAYGSPDALNMPLVDPRYKWVNPKGKAPTIFGLAGTWASDTQYGIKIEGLLSRMTWY